MSKLFWLFFCLVLAGCSGESVNTPKALRADLPAIIGGYEVEQSSARARSTVYIEVAFYKGATRINNVRCTGVIVTPTVIVTAAHCIRPAGVEYDTARTVVAFGSDLKDRSNLTVWTTEEVVIHPQYLKNRSSSHDLAIVKIGKEVPFPFRPAELLMNAEDSLKIGTPLFALGYGWTSEATESSSTKLKEVSLPVAEIAWDYFSLRSSSANTPCRGDSGGPVYFESDGVSYLVGTMVSVTGFGRHICDNTTKFTKLESHLDFLLPYLE